MNLQTRIPQKLWEAIKSSYGNGNFTGAILDSMHFLSDLLREKAGIEADGAALVGQALGGNSPKVRINRLQSDTDWNIQKGIEQIIRGLYQAVRNPRSHEKLNDSEEAAQAIIIFVGYLVSIIDQSKTPFSLNDFVSRVLEPNFVSKARYAELLVREIPARQRLNVFFEVYRKKDHANREHLTLFFGALLKEMSEEEKSEVHQAISDELKTVDNESIILTILSCFHSEWQHIEEVAKLRIENNLLRSIKRGTYENDAVTSGQSGTWSTKIFKSASLKTDFANTIVHKLRSADKIHQDYVFETLISGLGDLLDKQNIWLEKPFIEGMQRGDSRFYNASEYLAFLSREKLSQEFLRALEEYRTTHPEEDDIPF